MYYYSPDALQSSILFGTASRLVWPASELLDAEDLDENEKEVKPSKLKKFRVLNYIANKIKPRADRKWGEKSWWFGMKNNCYIGVYCTGSTTYTKCLNIKDSTFEVTRNGLKVQMVVCMTLMSINYC